MERPIPMLFKSFVQVRVDPLVTFSLALEACPLSFPPLRIFTSTLSLVILLLYFLRTTLPRQIWRRLAPSDFSDTLRNSLLCKVGPAALSSTQVRVYKLTAPPSV